MLDNISKKDINGNKRDTGITTRRRVLRTISVTGVAGVGMPGLAVADDNSQTSSDLEQTAKGTTEFIRDDSETPDWFTIYEEDELEYRLEGVYGSPFEPVDPNEISTNDLGCLGTTLKAFGIEVGATLCHYGGCDYDFELCAGICLSTGRLDNCDEEYHLSGSLGPVLSAELSLYPQSIGSGPMKRLIGLKVEGEICRYDPFQGSVCSTVSHEYGEV